MYAYMNVLLLNGFIGTLLYVCRDDCMYACIHFYAYICMYACMHTYLDV